MMRHNVRGSRVDRLRTNLVVRAVGGAVGSGGGPVESPRPLESRVSSACTVGVKPAVAVAVVAVVVAADNQLIYSR